MTISKFGISTPRKLANPANSQPSEIATCMSEPLGRRTGIVAIQAPRHGQATRSEESTLSEPDFSTRQLSIGARSVRRVTFC